MGDECPTSGAARGGQRGGGASRGGALVARWGVVGGGLPQNDPKRGEKEGKSGAHSNLTQISTPLRDSFLGGLNYPPCLNIFGLDDPNLTQSNSNP